MARDPAGIPASAIIASPGNLIWQRRQLAVRRTVPDDRTVTGLPGEFRDRHAVLPPGPIAATRS